MNIQKTTKGRTVLFLSILSIMLTFMILPVNAAHYTYTIKNNATGDYKNSASNVFYLETKYHLGNWIPFNDTSLKGVAGAKTFKMRYVYVYITGSKTGNVFIDTTQSYSAIGSGVQNIHKQVTLRGEDASYPATGYAINRVYNGQTTSSSIHQSHRVDVKK